jgi:glycosyltransferase involved in cell wall biosynthesis
LRLSQQAVLYRARHVGRGDENLSSNGAGRQMSRKPSLLMIGRTRYRLPLNESLRAKFDALAERFHMRVLASGVEGAPRRDDVFELAGPWRPRRLDGALYFLTLPFRTRRELRSTPPDAVLVQGAHETWFVLLGRALSGARPHVILEVHGDWRSSTRLYGSPARGLLNPIADRVALSALRGADAVRTISDYTSGLVRSHGVEPAAVFPAFMDLDPFLGPTVPLPRAPRALFVGVLEHYKGIDELAEAWRIVAARLPEVTLHLVGRGSRREVVERLVAELPDRTEWTEVLPTKGIADALDAATVLVLPSRSEGMGRVLVEAFCRGRAAVASRVGGIVDLVRDRENGLLVPPRDPQALADALERVLADRGLAEQLGAGAKRSAETWVATPDEYAARLEALVAGLR